MKGKKIIVGITGSIAAYKTAQLVRLLAKAGAEVRVVMTEAAKDFITPLTLSVLSGNEVLSEFSNSSTGRWNNHVEMGTWADVLLIAPLSASTLSKMATGQCDNLLMAVYLSARCPVMVAPAMDLDMWKHETTIENIKTIARHGVHIIPPAKGELASGLHGEGRMEEPENIFNILNDFFVRGLSLLGIKALVTAGPTYEAIDPVRFIGNRSSGKMGFALAQELASRGAEVTLISGPSAEQLDHPLVNRINVESASAMHQVCMEHFPKIDLTIMAAAVADYRPVSVESSKMKKSTDSLNLELEPTVDILAAMGKMKTPQQVLVGFALETNNEIENAKAKLKRKNLDYILLNSLRDEGAGFGHETNKVTILSAVGESKSTVLKSKRALSVDIIDTVIATLKK